MMQNVERRSQVRKGASVAKDAVTAARELHAAIGQKDIALAVFYASPEYDLNVLGAELARLFAGVQLVGCTTAGEITPIGYLNGSLTGFSIAAPDFLAVTKRIDDLRNFELTRGEQLTKEMLAQLADRGQAPNGSNTFGLLLIDGLSMQEEAVVSALHRNMSDIQLFGGSAADGVRFQKTWVWHEGSFRTDCAVVILAQTSLAFEVFKTEHFVSSNQKMVVTKADPTRRIVTEVNGLPAGREYARMVGLEVDKLTPLIFATYPVVVRLGGTVYVRSIQKVNDDESLTFFCAIDEGIVLTVARGVDIVANLEQAFGRVREHIGVPQLVIGCDCILRNLELEQKHVKDAAARILVDNNVVGFSTYGEQFNSMHVNQTFTGVAIGGNSR